MKERKVLRSFAMISQIGISMMVPIFLCGVIGHWLNSYFHNEVLFLLALLVGIGAAFRNMFLLTKSFYAADQAKEKREADYIRNLREYHREHPEEEFPDVMEGKKKRYPENRGPTRH